MDCGLQRLRPNCVGLLPASVSQHWRRPSNAAQRSIWLWPLPARKLYGQHSSRAHGFPSDDEALERRAAVLTSMGSLHAKTGARQHVCVYGYGYPRLSLEANQPGDRLPSGPVLAVPAVVVRCSSLGLQVDLNKLGDDELAQHKVLHASACVVESSAFEMTKMSQKERRVWM